MDLVNVVVIHISKEFLTLLVYVNDTRNSIDVQISRHKIQVTKMHTLQNLEGNALLIEYPYEECVNHGVFVISNYNLVLASQVNHTKIVVSNQDKSMVMTKITK